jgi:VIT1/CCC1 family predicted Fe2+/Mn2+ transporter
MGRAKVNAGAANVADSLTIDVSRNGLRAPRNGGDRHDRRKAMRMHARVLQTMLAKTSGVEGSTLGRIEGRHHSVAGNTLRAAVLGANDGLCSNLSLVMGIAGASVNEHTVLLGGIAGLLAGACSMGLGEWVSVTSSRELADRELKIERDELDANPEQEREGCNHLRSQGLSAEEARPLDQAPRRPVRPRRPLA